MAKEQPQWHWQEPGSAWKGVGIYHVTLTVPSREPLLGELVIPDNEPKQAWVQRTELGNAVVDCIWKVPKLHPEVRVISFDLMPDHIHTIWHVVRPMPVGIKTVVRGFWQGVRKCGRAYSMPISPNSIRDNEHRLVDPLFATMPFISKQEKMVMEVLLKERHPFIYIADNGFRDYYKPQEALFDAVGEGRVLILTYRPIIPIITSWNNIQKWKHPERCFLHETINS